jgi:electron transport complex protein RnfD
MDKKILDKFDYDTEIPVKTENKVKKADKPSRIYFEQLLCLCLLAVIAYWNSGARVAVMAGFSICGAVLMDMIGCAMTKKIYNPRDLSTLTAGLCVALLMPAGIAYQLAFFGSALTIAIKHIFGGKDNYIFNPTAAAFAFLILCYPGAMLIFPKPLEHLPVWGEINPVLLSGLPPIESVSTFNILMGNFVGAMGTVHILVILVTAVCLMFRRSVSATVTVSALAANLLFSGNTGSEAGLIREILFVLVSGYFLFILVFLVNDPQTLPKTFLGKIYYGVLFGSAAVLFRHFGKVEGYPAFALLIVNTMTERCDVLASQTVTSVRRAVVFAQERLNSYERIREMAQEHDHDRDTAVNCAVLTDSQDIIIDRQDYDMPPVDNKIIKINRKKPGLIIRIKEKIGNLSDKRKSTDEHEPETSDVNFLENLREGVKDLGSVFRKRELLEMTDEEPVEEMTPLQLSLIIDEDDVVEIETEESTKSSKKKKAGRR